jgi:transcriptional regulator with XRE-family HTH domain
MAIKPRTVLSRDDFREAMDANQLSISQVAKATGIPRSYLSEFLSIGRPLKPEQLQRIRDHLESEGVEFEDAPAAEPSALPASLAVANICHFPIRPDRVEEAKSVLAEIDRNDVRIAELLGKQAKRKTGLFGDEGDFTSRTEADLRELFALFGANYMLFRYLTLEKSPLDSVKDEKTVRSAMVGLLKTYFDNAGVRAGATDEDAPAPDSEPAEEEEAA